MSKIHFENLSGNWKVIVLLILAMGCIIFGTFKLIDFGNPKVNQLLSVAGFLLFALFFSRMFWYKNYVQWNKKGIAIRIKSFTGTSFRFDEIAATELNGNKLTVTKKDGSQAVIDLEGIVESDIHKLNEIIANHRLATG